MRYVPPPTNISPIIASHTKIGTGSRGRIVGPPAKGHRPAKREGKQVRPMVSPCGSKKRQPWKCEWFCTISVNHQLHSKCWARNPEPRLFRGHLWRSETSHAEGRASVALRHRPADRRYHRSVLRRPHAGDIRQVRRWLVLVAAPTWMFAGWLAYWAVRYELLRVSARNKYSSHKRTTPPSGIWSLAALCIKLGPEIPSVDMSAKKVPGFDDR